MIAHREHRRLNSVSLCSEGCVCTGAFNRQASLFAVCHSVD
ncbi:gallidermin family protein [Candidatus Saccharibacteria bacterium]|nr:gallidermin family protein [Candidatus Saccharibacteria bacterium]NCS83199.1 gallidermin family protein [Candidatus Saccharibacteria bacterium]